MVLDERHGSDRLQSPNSTRCCPVLVILEFHQVLADVRHAQISPCLLFCGR